jgi:hypothetical protein
LVLISFQPVPWLHVKTEKVQVKSRGREQVTGAANASNGPMIAPLGCGARETEMNKLSAIAVAVLMLAVPAMAEDAMAPAADAMAPAADAMAPAMEATMTPISDADFDKCMAEAKMMSFDAAMAAASAACHGLHQGMDVMGAIENAMGDDAMGAMAPAQ